MELQLPEASSLLLRRQREQLDPEPENTLTAQELCDLEHAGCTYDGGKDEETVSLQNPSIPSQSSLHSVESIAQQSLRGQISEHKKNAILSRTKSESGNGLGRTRRRSLLGDLRQSTMSLRGIVSSTSRRRGSFLLAPHSTEHMEEWDVHPEQEMSKSTCSAEVILRLVKRCLHASRSLSYSKKKHISGMMELENALQQLESKLKAQDEVLAKYADSAEVKQLLLALQDTLSLLLRKYMSISKRKYFLDAAYGKRIMLLLQKLTNGTSDLFMALSRLVIVDSIEVQRKESLGSNENVRNMWNHVRRLSQNGLISQVNIALQQQQQQQSQQAERQQSSKSKNLNNLEQSLVEVQETKEDIEETKAPPLPPKKSSKHSKRRHSLKKEKRKGSSSSATASSISSDLEIQPNIQGKSSIFHEYVANNNQTSPRSLYQKGKLEILQRKFDVEGGDYRQAIVYLAQAAQAEYVPAMLYLAQIYEKGEGIENPDLDLAKHFYSCALAAGDADGRAEFALFLLRHYPEEHTEALHLLKESVRMGSAKGACFLGELYYVGKLVPINKAKARALFASAAVKENSRAQNNLAVLLMEQDPRSVEARKLLEMSASKGLVVARNNLGLLLEGMGYRNEALKAYQKASEQGYVPATANYGYLLTLIDNGDGTHLQEAEGHLQSAAVQGVAEANIYLGFVLDAKGISESDRAMYHLQLGIQQITSQLEAQRSHTKDTDQMLSILSPEKQTQLVAQAASRIADIHYRKQDYPHATAKYKFAAKLGDANAINALGLMCESGKCTRGICDLERAKNFYTAAFEQGCADAGFNLAMLAFRERKLKEARNFINKTLKLDKLHERANELDSELTKLNI